VFIFPGDEENQSDAGANRGVGDVEGGKSDFAAAAPFDIKAEKIHDFMPDQTVGEISGDAAKNQAERDLAGQSMRVEMMTREKKRDEREQADECERAVVAAEKAPGRAGISPVNELEKAGHNNFFLVISK